MNIYLPKLLLKIITKIMVLAMTFMLIPALCLAEDKTEKQLKDLIPDDILSRNYFLESWSFLQEKEKELGQLNFTIKTDFNSNEAGNNTASKLSISASASKGIYPYEVEFETGSSFTFQNSNDENKFLENIISTRINYERYIYPWIEGFAFFERFSDSYLHVDQRYEIGFGGKLEFDCGYKIPPQMDMDKRWPSFVELYRKLLIQRFVLDALLSIENLKDLKKEQINLENFIKIYMDDNLLDYKMRIESLFDQELYLDTLSITKNASDKAIKNIVLDQINEEIAKIEKESSKYLDKNCYDCHELYNKLQHKLLEEKYIQVKDLINKLEKFRKDYDRIKYSLQKTECPLQLGFSMAIFYELNQSKGNFSTKNENNELVPCTYSLPQEDKIRYSLRPSIVFRLLDSLELASYVYYKGIFHGDSRRQNYRTNDYLYDNRWDIFSYLKITWPIKDSWAKSISMSAVFNYNYINIPPYLDTSVINALEAQKSITIFSNDEADYRETKHFTYGLKLEIKF